MQSEGRQEFEFLHVFWQNLATCLGSNSNISSRHIKRSTYITNQIIQGTTVVDSGIWICASQTNEFEQFEQFWIPHDSPTSMPRVLRGMNSNYSNSFVCETRIQIPESTTVESYRLLLFLLVEVPNKWIRTSWCVGSTHKIDNGDGAILRCATSVWFSFVNT